MTINELIGAAIDVDLELSEFHRSYRTVMRSHRLNEVDAIHDGSARFWEDLVIIRQLLARRTSDDVMAGEKAKLVALQALKDFAKCDSEAGRMNVGELLSRLY